MTAEAVSLAVTIEAQRGVLKPLGQRPGMDTSQVWPSHLIVAVAAGLCPQFGGRLYLVGSMAALTLDLCVRRCVDAGRKNL